ncbi:Bgt-5473 [Blumeria graminis f. sp. tritici]|uniref:Bgt-5473 n=2 Tax=Blumeria graminis f. sp. tritici TaxID=62690 RepID=A0A381LEE7_BLUGR|nr:Tat binding protein 1TBP-1-interacting protein TBPIP [Blumeria graminis f. sp. tritici 96224]VDB88861.1 Bgt-5473 [Blumeria graminis f. sp. tritici]
MPPRKHKLEEVGVVTSTIIPSPSVKTDKLKVERQRLEKKPKVEKVKKDKVNCEEGKKEKSDGKKTESLVRAVKESKEKVATIHGEQANELLVTYLKEQNRPYSATEISANLHGKVARAMADKLLKEMSESGKINSKSTKGNEKGSQWVFWALQDSGDTVSAEYLAQMDETIKSLQENVAALKVRLKAAVKDLEAARNAPTLVDISENITRLHEENRVKREKLERCQMGGDTVVTKEELIRIERDFHYWPKKRAARKRAFQNLEDLLLETKSREELWEEAGIEEDTY